MKSALILSVVAQVAVSQPLFVLPEKPFQTCDYLAPNMQCCFPEVFGGCQAPPGLFPRGMVPFGYMPPPQFLSAVCCPKGRECCPIDQRARQPNYRCCDADESCNIVDNKGTCISGNEGNGTTPEDVDQLDYDGRCPSDGSLPILMRPGEVLRCSLNNYIQGYKCPSNTECVRDLSGNVNSGVCCPVPVDGGCAQYSNCTSCVQNTNNVRAPCSWLSQGDLSNDNPRCVVSCDNFPGQGCIVPSSGHMCPTTADYNGTNYNTGSCNRRCGLIGTGRAEGINNNGLAPFVNPDIAANVTTNPCCADFPGDYCCNSYGALASHCAPGRTPGGPVCGVPIRGSPNTLFNSPNPYMPYAPFMPYAPMPMPMPYGIPPMGFGPMPYGFVPMGPYGPGPYGPYGRAATDSAEVAKNQLFFPPAPMFYPPMPPPRPLPPVINTDPSPFVCSCDKDCETKYDDCCSDYLTLCATN